MATKLTKVENYVDKELVDQLVDQLVDLLKMAKKGDVVAMAVATVDKGGTTHQYLACEQYYIRLIGSVELMKYQLVGYVDEQSKEA